MRANAERQQYLKGLRKLECPDTKLCNVMLGMADDNTEMLRAAISYLEENK